MVQRKASVLLDGDPNGRTEEKEMTSEQLAEIKARLEKATPGPWTYKGGILGNKYLDQNPGIFLDRSIEPPINNIEFISHAPTDIAALVAEVERLRAFIDVQERIVFAQLSDVNALKAQNEKYRAALEHISTIAQPCDGCIEDNYKKSLARHYEDLAEEALK